jgi:hypothetical protein
MGGATLDSSCFAVEVCYDSKAALARVFKPAVSRHQPLGDMNVTLPWATSVAPSDLQCSFKVEVPTSSGQPSILFG